MKRPAKTNGTPTRWGKADPAVVALTAELRRLARAIRARYPRAVGAAVCIDFGPREEPRSIPVFGDWDVGVLESGKR